jgi:hypothetical protein
MLTQITGLKERTSKLGDKGLQNKNLTLRFVDLEFVLVAFCRLPFTDNASLMIWWEIIFGQVSGF